MKELKRINIDGKYYRLAMARRETEDPCGLCHFTNDVVNNCPRMDRPLGMPRTPLYCSHYDDFGVGGSAYLIRDTKKGHAEWVARKLGVADE